MSATFYPQDPLPLWQRRPAPGAGPAGVAALAAREAWRDRFPPRYGTDFWRQAFDRRLAGALPEAERILDVGAGAWPVVPPGQRPVGTTYVGLDIDRAELEAAPDGAYDRMIAADVTRPPPELAGGFDLVLSWFMLELVDSLPVALAAMRSFLRPGGRLLAQFSGQLGIFSVLNRVVPDRAARVILSRTMDRREETVFPAVYDRCRHDAIATVLAGQDWARWEVTPLWVAGLYTRFARPLFAVYMAYEEVAFRRGWRNLAPYYLVDAIAG